MKRCALLVLFVPVALGSSSTGIIPTSTASQIPVSVPSITNHPTPASASFTGNGGTTCTVTDYASISSAVASCSNILLSDISAPPSSTIDLQDLQTGAAVIFDGTTVSLPFPQNQRYI